jgi:hypothetical protein
LAVRVTPVHLDAGSLSDDAKLRFGGGVGAAIPALQSYLSTNPGATFPELVDKTSDLIFGSTGRQKDDGVGLAVALDIPSEGIKTDIGVSPMGFLYSTAVGGISIKREFSATRNLRYEASLSRRSVTDSLTSFAGSKDARTGLEWGGVTANGGRAELSYDDGDIGAYGYGALHSLRGNNVKSNTRAELGSGIYWYLYNDDSRIMTAGLSLNGVSYENNQGNFTFGSGGYFSPQQFYSIAIPFSWAHSGKRWSYKLLGSVGVQHIEQDSAAYFPNDNDMQQSLELISDVAEGFETLIPTSFEGSSDTGIGYSLSGVAEYQMGKSLFFGGHMGVDNAQDYRQWNGGLYLRYMFEDMTQPMVLPVSPYRSPYSK